MMNLVIHGVYDLKTLNSLRELGVNFFSMDLRGKSPNLVTFKELNFILDQLQSGEKVYLTFENEKAEVVYSFIDLLNNKRPDFEIIFRDHQEITFYRKFKRNFFWMLNPYVDWKSMLLLENLKGILLPLKFQDQYLKMSELWAIAERRKLDVYLFAENFEQSQLIEITNTLKLVIDMTAEVELSYRNVDQLKLKKMIIRGHFNENSPF